jgi:outer membrane protein OmpA-like peptidoglycan-associated protein
MFRRSATMIAACAVSAALAVGQASRISSPDAQAPLYQVTVIGRGTDAVTYQYRSGPTKIDFRGTVLLPEAKGEATVESRRGGTEINAKFDRLTPPSRYGRMYLTYVLWAISPEGTPQNLGEIIPNSSNHGKIRVTTDLSTFAMIVTAEPYAAIRQPSDLVTLENRLRPDTMGKVVPVQIKAELMPRGDYTWQVHPQPAPSTTARKVSMSQYEALLELYQAQNAVAIAKAANADHYAADSFAAAQQALDEAQRLESNKVDATMVIDHARRAVQAAEDARTIAERRQLEAGISSGRAAASPKRQGGVNEANREVSEQPLRALLHRRIDGSLLSQDTPNGLVIILPDTAFDGNNLLASISEKLGPLASTLLSQPGVHVQVDGYADSAELQSWDRAQAVRNKLVASGLSPFQISVRGGASAPNRAPDRRVQIVIQGAP